ncbi:MAG: radical SAM protein [Asgard group archaeon]|nr:radical SAM protein [Asgard group archaeon]
MNNLYSIDLTKILPFHLNISKIDESLHLTKGVLSGRIPFDNLRLELEKNYSLNFENEFIKQYPNGGVLLTFKSKEEIDSNELHNLIQEIIAIELPYNLQNNVTKKPLFYVTNNYYGIPLIGSLYFGIIDRGTNLLQVRAITGCPLNCPFCSVDEGPTSKTKIRDFIIDTDYLVDSYNFVVNEKGINDVEAHLDGQGEPMAYPYLAELIQKFRDNQATKIVSIQTNGWFLTEQLIDELAEVGLSRINLSLNAIDLTLGKKLAGRGDYNLERILELADYIAKSKIALLIAPIWIPGINNDEITKLINFTKQINSSEKRYPILGIQNYLSHNEGRNIKGVKTTQFRDFYLQLKSFENKFGVKQLVLKQSMFKTHKTKMIDNPMRKNEIVTAEIASPGRLPNEVLGIAKNRIIHISMVEKISIGRKIKVKIIRNRHNIFFAKPV